MEDCAAEVNYKYLQTFLPSSDKPLASMNDIVAELKAGKESGFIDKIKNEKAKLEQRLAFMAAIEEVDGAIHRIEEGAATNQEPGDSGILDQLGDTIDILAGNGYESDSEMSEESSSSGESNLHYFRTHLLSKVMEETGEPLRSKTPKKKKEDESFIMDMMMSPSSQRASLKDSSKKVPESLDASKLDIQFDQQSDGDRPNSISAIQEQRLSRQAARLMARKEKRADPLKGENETKEEREAMADEQVDRMSSGYSTISSTQEQLDLVILKRNYNEKYLVHQSDLISKQQDEIKKLESQLSLQQHLKATQKLVFNDSFKADASSIDLKALTTNAAAVASSSGKNKSAVHASESDIKKPRRPGASTKEANVSRFDSALKKTDNEGSSIMKSAVSQKEEAKASSVIKLMDPSEEVNSQFTAIERILESDRFKNCKNKNSLTISPLTEEEINFFRFQEAERYKYPHRPWIYFNSDGSTSLVGPVVKKNKNGAQISVNNKPRDHQQLHTNRPGIVTLLCLARDAASRLPDGVGTRADILDLIKHSQWLKIEGIDQSKLNNIVSGALDRLHYEPDPCVKYDSERKLWIYIHNHRNFGHSEWKESVIETFSSCSEQDEDAIKEIFYPLCLQNNATNIADLIAAFPAIAADLNVKLWRESKHKNEFIEDLDALLQVQKDNEAKRRVQSEQRQLRKETEKQQQVQMQQQQKMQIQIQKAEAKAANRKKKEMETLEKIKAKDMRLHQQLLKQLNSKSNNQEAKAILDMKLKKQRDKKQKFLENLPEDFREEFEKLLAIDEESAQQLAQATEAAANAQANGTQLAKKPRQPRKPRESKADDKEQLVVKGKRGRKPKDHGALLQAEAAIGSHAPLFATSTNVQAPWQTNQDDNRMSIPIDIFEDYQVGDDGQGLGASRVQPVKVGIPEFDDSLQEVSPIGTHGMTGHHTIPSHMGGPSMNPMGHITGEGNMGFVDLTESPQKRQKTKDDDLMMFLPEGDPFNFE